MLFLILFIAGGMILPVMIDIQKHGGNNIFRRSGRDFLEYEPVQASLKFLHVSAKRVNATVVGTISVVSLFVILYLGFKVIDVARYIIELFR